MDAEPRSGRTLFRWLPPRLWRVMGGGDKSWAIARWVVAILLVTSLSGLLVARLRSAHQTITAHPSLSAIAVRMGEAAPDFTLTPLSGAGAHAIRLSALRGRAVVINFWSPSCAPCRDEAPILAHAAQQYASAGVVFVGVALESTHDDVMSFTRAYKIPYTCGLDSTNDIAVAYGLVAIPVTVVVDRRGMVAGVIQGAVSASRLGQAIASALERSDPVHQTVGAG
ncbi:MAG TPA: TlpA disulfide reductase family protein [Ktedonobacterales bacterium]